LSWRRNCQLMSLEEDVDAPEVPVCFRGIDVRFEAIECEQKSPPPLPATVLVITRAVNRRTFTYRRIARMSGPTGRRLGRPRHAGRPMTFRVPVRRSSGMICKTSQTSQTRRSSHAYS
jgi:hypothetical protein